MMVPAQMKSDGPSLLFSHSLPKVIWNDFLKEDMRGMIKVILIMMIATLYNRKGLTLSKADV